MTDPIETLMALRDHIESLMVDAEALAEKHKQERAALDAKLVTEAANTETRLVIAVALQAIEIAIPYVRHEGPRSPVTGAREQLRKALSA